jgi:glucose-1-phosphate thymidylyltransferase
MKGIILAGGHGTRLYPLTKYISKQLLPIYDKPMIYYPLSVLMEAKIKDILIITNPEFVDLYKDLFGDGSHLGLKIQYKIQNAPRGIAEAFILGEEFIGKDNVCLVLGDNLFVGKSLQNLLCNCSEKISRGICSIVAYKVNDPERFGVVDFENDMTVKSIEEKPKKPKSEYAVTGIYFYKNNVVDLAKKLKPSERGELEITDINNAYINNDTMSVEIMDSKLFKWLDTGTFDALNEASDYIRSLQKKENQQIGLLDEIAYRNNFIDLNQLKKNLSSLSVDLQKYLLKRYLDS